MHRILALTIAFVLVLPFPARAEEDPTASEMRKLDPRILAILRRRPSPAEIEMKRGDFWVMMRRFDKAEAHYKKAMELDPKLVLARFRYAFCAHKLGRTDEALAELRKVLEIDPKHLPAYQALADIHIGRKNLAEADAILQKALAVSPGNPAVLLYLGRVARQRFEAGDAAAKQKAEEYLEKARAAARPGTPVLSQAERELAILKHGKAGEQLADARDAIAKGDVERALSLLEEVLKAQAGLAEAHYLRGVALASPKLNRVSEAIAAYKQAATSEAHLAIAQLHYEKGEMEEAEEWLKKLLGADAKHQGAQYRLGLVYKELGEYDKALSAWRATVAIDSRSKYGRWAETKIQVLTGNVRWLAEGEVLDPAAERHLGQRFMAKLEKQYGFVNDDALVARLDGIARKLIAVSDRSGESLRYEIRVVNKGGVNAVTFPGGKILIFRGMVDLIRKELGDSDDAYAAVLGHEIAHAALRHGVTKAKILSARSSLDSPQFSAALTLHSFLSGFSRHNEFEADQYGALYAYRAGYNPAAGMALHEKMGGRREIPPGLSHPPHRERIERLREYLLDLRGKTRTFRLGIKALKKHDYARAVQHFEVFLGVFPGSVAARNNLGLAMHKKALLRIPAGAFKKSSDVDPRVRVPVIRLRAAEKAGVAAEKKEAPVIDRPVLREAIAELQIALRADPSYAPAHVNAGAALLDLGTDRETAMGHLQTALRLDPENREAQNNLAVAHLEAGENDKGVEILEKLQAASFADAIYNLAVVRERAGDPKEAARLFARYLEIDKDSGWAKLARDRIAAPGR
jgi:predicted Zn-dependent protease